MERSRSIISVLKKHGVFTAERGSVLASVYSAFEELLTKESLSGVVPSLTKNYTAKWTKMKTALFTYYTKNKLACKKTMSKLDVAVAEAVDQLRCGDKDNNDHDMNADKSDDEEDSDTDASSTKTLLPPDIMLRFRKQIDEVFQKHIAEVEEFLLKKQVASGRGP